MSYSYSNPVVYGPQYNEISSKKRNSVPTILSGAILGGGAGVFIGAKSRPHIKKSGEVVDSFAQTIYEKSISGLKDGTKEAYEVRNKIIQKIDSINTVDELKALLKENSKVKDELSTSLKENLDDYFRTVSDINLAENKNLIKTKLIDQNNTNYQKIKNQIQSCWNGDKKEFIKPSNMTDDLFNNIKKTAKNLKWKNIAVCAGIGAITATITGMILNKIINKKNKV